jgi:hypothetical protein
LTSASLPTVDQTIIDGSTNAVSGNAVFDGLATKAPIVHTHNLQSVINAGNTIVNGSMYFKNSSGIQEAYFREYGVSFNYTQSYGLAGLYQSSFGSQGLVFSFTSNTDSVYNTLSLSTDNLSGGGSKQVKIQNKSGTIALLSDIPSPTAVDQTIIDGTTNALNLKLDLDLSTQSNANTLTGTETLFINQGGLPRKTTINNIVGDFLLYSYSF